MSAWIAVASADRVERGRAGGFMQVCHGKAAPLRRVRPQDLVAYYSPTRIFGEKQPHRCFTAMGIVTEGEPWQVEMPGGFRPWRRSIVWFSSRNAPIVPLLDRLTFSAGIKNWGAPFRFGLFAISERDMGSIAAAMQALWCLS